MLLLALVVWRLAGGERTITVNLVDAPLHKVISAIERQGGVRIHTNIDPQTPVTLRLRHAPLIDAIDTLAIRVDGNWQTAYIAGPDDATIRQAIAVYESNGEADTPWRSHYIPSMGGFGITSASDPRGQVWEVTPMEDNELGSYLSQAAQKTSALFAVPEEWNPELRGAPRSGPLERAVPAMVRSAGGKVAEVFLISRQNWRRGGGGDGEPRERGGRQARAEGGAAPQAQRGEARGPRGIFTPARRGGAAQANPEWVAERVANEIAQLPPEEREELQRDFEEMRQMWETVRALPPEERRERMREIFDNPSVQDRIQDRMARREARMSPEQREARFRRYVDRKTQAREEAGRPMGPQGGGESEATQ